MEVLLYLGIFIGLLILGITVGGLRERRHFKRLDLAEADLAGIVVTNLKTVPRPETVTDSGLVLGHVVIATDYFKTLATSLRNLVGGQMKAARKLMIRARREAVVRMLRQARDMDSTEVVNVRFQFCSISMMRGKRGAIQVEILAWGTAIKRSA